MPLGPALLGLAAAVRAAYVTDANISAAVLAWREDAVAAEASYGHIGTWDTSDVTRMDQLFYDDGTFDEDLGAWNTARVTSMQGLFWRTDVYNRPLESWDVSRVTDMSRMFSDNARFNQPLNGWTTSSLESTRHMFYYAEAFNQPLDRWDVSKLTSMDNMFECVSAFDQDLGWHVSANCTASVAFFNTRCRTWDCGLNGATPPPTPPPTYPEASGAHTTEPLILLGAAALAYY